MAIFCDTHVHCYDFSKIAELFDYAATNFLKQGSAKDHFVLFFTDGQVDKTWVNLNKAVAPHYFSSIDFGSWVLNKKPLQGSIIAKNKATGVELNLLPARQLNSKERLEFLVLGLSENDPDGDAAIKIVDKYSKDYLVISPWGVGKWLFGRSKILSNLLRTKGSLFHLGDNGGRPWWWVWVSHFRQSPLTILNGSDPLPISGELARVGSFGVRLDVDLARSNKNEDLSCKQLIGLLRSESVPKQNYGKPLGLIRFLVSRYRLKN